MRTKHYLSAGAVQQLNDGKELRYSPMRVIEHGWEERELRKRKTELIHDVLKDTFELYNL